MLADLKMVGKGICIHETTSRQLTLRIHRCHQQQLYSHNLDWCSMSYTITKGMGHTLHQSWCLFSYGIQVALHTYLPAIKSQSILYQISMGAAV